MEIKDNINIAKDFSRSVGARYRDEGENSGQRFLEDILLPKFEKAVEEKYIILVNLERLFGFPSSFVSGSFGKLSVTKGADLVLEHLQFQANDNPLRKEKAIREIKNPKKGDRD